MGEEKKRSRLYIYGERTTGVSILVPESKKSEITEKFYDVLKEYENPKMLDLEKTSKLDKKTNNITDILDENNELRVKFNEDGSVETITESIEGIAVPSLPKDKKKIDVGLYSGSGKFYTNKIVSNELQIIEWTNVESAKSYLENLK